MGYLTKFGALKLNGNQVMILETWLKIPYKPSAILWQRLPKPYKLLIFSRLPWYSRKWANIVIFELVPSDAWRILQFNRKTEKFFKEIMRIERWICKIALDPGHLLLLLLLFFFHWRRIENDWRLKLTNSDISDSKLLDFLDQNEKICKLHCKKGK